MTLKSASRQNDSPLNAPHQARRILATGFFAMSVFGISIVILPTVLKSVSAEFNRNLAECGMLMVFAPAGFVVSTLVGGYLSDRLGQRLFLLIGFAMMGSGLLLIALTGTYGLLQVGLFTVGISGGFVESPVSAAAANAFPTRRAQALNITQLFFNVGAVGGPVIVASILWLGGGWRTCFGAVSLLAISAFLLCLFGMPSMAHHRASRAAETDRVAIRWGIVTFMAVTMFLYVGGELTIAKWSAKYLIETFDTVEPRAALVVSGFWLGMMVGRALYVVLVGRMGYLPPLLLSALLAGATGIGVALARSGFVAALGCALMGFFLGGTWPTILAYTAHRSAGRTGTVFGVLVAAGAMGALAVPPLAGWLAEASASGLRAAMGLGTAFILIEGVLVLALWLRSGHRGGIGRSSA